MKNAKDPSMCGFSVAETYMGNNLSGYTPFMDRFGAARLKVKRADEHIADLEAIISALPNAYVSTVEINQAGGETIRHGAPDFTETIQKMALIIGDAIHNLRTAIEYAYLGAIERHAPSELDAHTKFPVRKSREEVEVALKGRKIDVLSPTLFNGILSQIKPYIVGGQCLINFLHDLDISDKHWLLIPTMRVATVTGVVVQDEKGNLRRGETYPIRGDDPFFIDFLPGIKVKDKGKITVDVVFDDFDLLKGLPVLSDLKDFSKVAAYVVEVLERL